MNNTLTPAARSWNACITPCSIEWYPESSSVLRDFPTTPTDATDTALPPPTRLPATSLTPSRHSHTQRSRLQPYAYACPPVNRKPQNVYGSHQWGGHFPRNINIKASRCRRHRRGAVYSKPPAGPPPLRVNRGRRSAQKGWLPPTGPAVATPICMGCRGDRLTGFRPLRCPAPHRPRPCGVRVCRRLCGASLWGLAAPGWGMHTPTKGRPGPCPRPSARVAPRPFHCASFLV